MSLARHISEAGFETWILEVRGAGLSKREGEPTSSELGGTDGALGGAVQDAFVQATIKNATKATRNKDNGAPSKNQKETALVQQSNGLAKSDNSTEDDTVASRLANGIAQISQILKTLVSEGQSRILVAKFIEQVKSICT